ncbi:MAG: substrate-binding domain-containing protein [Solirubrobacteraceae bacterium]
MQLRVFRGAGIAGALAALAVGLGACGSSGSSATQAGGKKQFVIGYSQSNNAEAYRAQVNIQLQHYVKQYPDLKLLPITDAHQDSTTQVGQVQNFIAQKVNVLMVSPNEPAPLAAPIEQACAAHIPVIILDRSVNSTCYTTFIGGNNVTIGHDAGEAALKLLPNGGNVVELRGILSDQPQIDRDKGFRQAIAANPKIKIIASREAKWLRPNATAIMQQWLSTYPKIDLVYAQNDEMALGAYLAAASANRQNKIKFTGIDGLAIPAGGIRAVQQGKLATTFIYPTGASEAAAIAEKIVHHQPVPHTIAPPTTQVTKQNAAALYQKLSGL